MCKNSFEKDRPRKRRRDDGEEVLKETGVRNWRKIVNEKLEWRRVVTKEKAITDCDTN